MKIYMKYFIAGNKNVCIVPKNIMRKIMEMYSLSLEQSFEVFLLSFLILVYSPPLHLPPTVLFTLKNNHETLQADSRTTKVESVLGCDTVS
jgi:hypothetical protein